MMSLLIDVMERRCIGIGDVPSVYLHAHLKDFDFMSIRFEDESVDTLCQINPEYENFVVIERGKIVLYLRFDKALYGCVVSALL